MIIIDVHEAVVADKRILFNMQLLEKLEEQQERERNLNYIFLFKNHLSKPTFEDALVNKMKDMKGRVDHLLDLDRDSTDGKPYDD